MTTILSNSGLVILGLVTLVWVISLVKKDAGIMDSFWGIGFILVALFLLLKAPQVSLTQLILTSAILLWGLRLSIHITYRNSRKKGEDPRYKNWREQNGKAWWWKSYLKVFITQGFVMWIVAAPIYAVFSNTTSSNLALLVLGVALFFVGFFFETIADWQLVVFKRNPDNQGKVLDRGLWALSRHPNYFGETVLWWGFGLMAFSAGAWWALISPLIMNYLLVRVSGVKMLDELLVKTNPEYADYIKSTPPFIPKLGKRKKN